MAPVIVDDEELLDEETVLDVLTDELDVLLVDEALLELPPVPTVIEKFCDVLLTQLSGCSVSLTVSLITSVALALGAVTVVVDAEVLDSCPPPLTIVHA